MENSLRSDRASWILCWRAKSFRRVSSQWRSRGVDSSADGSSFERGASPNGIVISLRRGFTVTRLDLGMPVLRGQVEQSGGSVVFLRLGELAHQIPGVLGRHLAVVFPLDAGEIGPWHWESVLGCRSYKLSTGAEPSRKQLILKRFGNRRIRCSWGFIAWRTLVLRPSFRCPVVELLGCRACCRSTLKRYKHQ